MLLNLLNLFAQRHDDVIKWKHFPRYCELQSICEGNRPVTGGFPAQRGSNGEKFSIRRRHNVHVFSRRARYHTSWKSVVAVAMTLNVNVSFLAVVTRKYVALINTFAATIYQWFTHIVTPPWCNVTALLIFFKYPLLISNCSSIHDDVIKWKHFPRNWPFVRGIHRSPVNSLHKGQWRGALIISLICVWINDWVNNREAGDLRRYRVLYDVIVMFFTFGPSAGCPECICNRPRPWRRPCVSDWGCGAVILLSRGEFGREKNKICYQRGCVWTFCYMPNLWYNIVILQHIFILRNNRCERFVFNLGSFARNRECETQVCVFGVFFLNIC